MVEELRALGEWVFRSLCALWLHFLDAVGSLIERVLLRAVETGRNEQGRRAEGKQGMPELFRRKRIHKRVFSLTPVIRFGRNFLRTGLSYGVFFETNAYSACIRVSRF
ncbi:hypothetical protein CRI94_07430 [Longibacter salinarum]|uniref:Uncharacterized protein n=1 Tax=Longibacter salinarum TaxID=1850348 RepID=A0A2A8CZ53_9BACT|nr:hypothetical protein CRI94_07430 [Longibacter salinarum]